ncbi:DNA/RNA non-specific endonuclease [Nocardioides sp. B-3]|uniref:DNA/RNA non-specific endonuclease n=1 Tax=Nocardioides sp. B-3 TaxID=2895565 RepID=UPI00300E032B
MTTCTSPSACTPPAASHHGSPGTSTGSGSSPATASADRAKTSAPTPASPPRHKPSTTPTRDNHLDRGHIARRSDLLWGTLDEARTANSDSFFFTNITPQIDDFNQSSRGGSWGMLENAVLAQEGLEDRRLTLFAGPVLRDDDPTYRNIVQLPREHWKVVAYRMDGQLRFKCFVLSRDLDRIDERAFLDGFDAYLVSLDFLEDRTGLTFPSLRENTSPLELRQQDRPVPVTDAEHVDW